MSSKILCAVVALVAASAASAETQPRPMPAVVTSALPAPRLATVFEIKLQLPEGRGLARMLIDAGVSKDDAARAAKLAGGHLGDGASGCSAKVEVSRAVEANGLRLERLVLSSDDGQTIVERRNGELTLNSAAVRTSAGAALI